MCQLCCCPCRVRKLTDFIKNILICEDEWRSYMFGTTGGWVINDKIIFLGWTTTLTPASILWVIYFKLILLKCFHDIIRYKMLYCYVTEYEVWYVTLLCYYITINVFWRQHRCFTTHSMSVCGLVVSTDKVLEISNCSFFNIQFHFYYNFLQKHCIFHMQCMLCMLFLKSRRHMQ